MASLILILTYPEQISVLNQIFSVQFSWNYYWEVQNWPLPRDSQTHYCWVKLDVCAIPVLYDYQLQTHSQSTSHPLSKFIDTCNVTRTSLTNNLCALLHVCGLDSASFAPHNFCIGAATTGAAGVADWLIKVFGRWTFNAHQTYIDAPKDAILQVPKDLASCLNWYYDTTLDTLRTLWCLIVTVFYCCIHSLSINLRFIPIITRAPRPPLHRLPASL